MPKFDGTGPWGYGPVTGWGMGHCGNGRRCGSGRGFGQGFRQRPWTKEDAISALEDEEKMLKQELEEIQKEKEYVMGQK